MVPESETQPRLPDWQHPCDQRAGVGLSSGLCCVALEKSGPRQGPGFCAAAVLWALVRQPRLSNGRVPRGLRQGQGVSWEWEPAWVWLGWIPWSLLVCAVLSHSCSLFCPPYRKREKGQVFLHPLGQEMAECLTQEELGRWRSRGQSVPPGV